MIEKLKDQGEKTVYVCPICDAEYEEYSTAEDCLIECATSPHEVQERTAKGNKWVCTDCEEEFNTQEEANKHPLNCLLVKAAAHPNQSNLDKFA